MTSTGHTLEQFKPTLTNSGTTPDERTKNFITTYQTAFHGPPPTPQQLRDQTLSAITSQATLTEVRDPDSSLDPLTAQLPVATFMRFPGKINLGGRQQSNVAMFTNATVRPTHKRRGLLRDMMTLNLTQAHEAGFPMALLNASSGGIYGRFGFQTVYDTYKVALRSGGLFHLAPQAQEMLSGKVQPVSTTWLQDNQERLYDGLQQQFRLAGTRHRAYYSEHFYDEQNGQYPRSYQAAIHLSGRNEPDGYVLYEIVLEDYPSPGKLLVHDLGAASPQAELSLWNYLANIELVHTIHYGSFPESSSLPLALADPRMLQIISGPADIVWVRILDGTDLLRRRPYSTIVKESQTRVHFQVEDPLGYLTGRYRLHFDASGANVTREDSAGPDQDLPLVTPQGLAALIFAYRPATQLAGAGLIKGANAETLSKWDTVFAPVGPAWSLFEF